MIYRPLKNDRFLRFVIFVEELFSRNRLRFYELFICKFYVAKLSLGMPHEFMRNRKLKRSHNFDKNRKAKRFVFIAEEIDYVNEKGAKMIRNNRRNNIFTFLLQVHNVVAITILLP